MEEDEFVKLKPGRIILAGVLDMHGRNWKVRPVVLLTSPHENDPEAEFRVACGSTIKPAEENSYAAIRLPGHHGPLGHPRTGLSEVTWFYAGWIASVKVGGVDDFKKFFPEHELLRLRELISQAEKKTQ